MDRREQDCHFESLELRIWSRTHFSGSFTLVWLQIWKFIRNSAGTQVNWRCFWPYHSQFISKQRCWLCENLFTQQASGMISMGRRDRLMSPKPHHYDKDLLENQHMLDSPLSFKQAKWWQMVGIEEKTKVSAEIIRQTLGNQRHDNQRFSPSTPPFVTGSKPSQFHWG